jgi:hypothetical protein
MGEKKKEPALVFYLHFFWLSDICGCARAPGAKKIINPLF